MMPTRVIVDVSGLSAARRDAIAAEFKRDAIGTTVAETCHYKRLGLMALCGWVASPARFVALGKPTFPEYHDSGDLSFTLNREAELRLRTPLMKGGALPDSMSRALPGAPAIRVGLIDGGCDARHPVLAGRVAEFAEIAGSGACFEAKPGQATQADPHGSMSASRIAGGPWEGTPVGLAPEADLVVAGAWLPGKAGFDDVQLIAAFEWMVERGVKLVCLPLERHVREVGALELIVMAARRAGVIPIVSAGNCRPPCASALARCTGAIAVGALDSNGKLTATSGSLPGGASQKAVPDVLAIGQVRVAWSVNGVPTVEVRDATTSLAACTFTGVAARLLHRFRTKSVEQVVKTLVQTASPASASGGSGRFLNEAAAIAELSR